MAAIAAQRRYIVFRHPVFGSQAIVGSELPLDLPQEPEGSDMPMQLVTVQRQNLIEKYRVAKWLAQYCRSKAQFGAIAMYIFITWICWINSWLGLSELEHNFKCGILAGRFIDVCGRFFFFPSLNKHETGQTRRIG